MIRMEIALILILAFVAGIYFSARRRQTALHKTFSALLIVVIVHLMFDAATIYTVNHLAQVPLVLNDVLHRLFVGTMALVLFFSISILRYWWKKRPEEADTGSAGTHISGDFGSRGDDASDYLHRDTGWKLFGGTLCICKLCQCGGVSHTLLMAAACELEADGQQEEIRHRHGSDL